MNYLLPLCVLLVLASCQTPYATLAESKTQMSPDRSAPGEQTPADFERRIVYDGYLRLVTPTPDSTAQRAVRAVERRNGYALEIGTERTVLRVPQGRVVETMDELAGLGKLRQRRLNGRDVSTQYYDLETRLANAQTTRDRYLELLERATEVTELLAVERELERISADIDVMTGQLNRLTELSDYATITLDLERKVKLGPVGVLVKGAYEAVRWLFVRN